MTKNHSNSPDYEFMVVDTLGREVIGESFFSAELSFIKCIQGEAVFTKNGTNHSFPTGSNFLLADSIHFKIVECSTDFAMRALRFELPFLNEIYPLLDNKIIDTMKYSSPDLYTPNELLLTDLTFQQLCLLAQNRSHAYRHRIALNLVISYILEIYEITYHHIDSRASNTSNFLSQVIGSFCLLCIEHHPQQRQIEFYADRLNISSRYLNMITQEAFQATPKQVIDFYVTGSIKRLLLTSALSIQQIADQLNFSDHATLSQYFKRNTGLSLTEFRTLYR